jgi:hypothetical protein
VQATDCMRCSDAHNTARSRPRLSPPTGRGHVADGKYLARRCPRFGYTRLRHGAVLQVMAMLATGHLASATAFISSGNT